MSVAANSTLVKLSIGDATPVAVGCQTSTGFEVSRGMVETSCKDGNGFAAYRPGIKSSTITIEVMIQTPAATGDPSALYAAWDAGTLLDVGVASTEPGVPSISGKGYVQNISLTADGIDNPVSLSVTIQLSGTFAAG